MNKDLILFFALLPCIALCTEGNTPSPLLYNRVKHRAEQIGHIMVIGAASTLGYIAYKTAHVFTGVLAKKIAPKIPLLALYPIAQHGYWLYKKSQLSLAHNNQNNKPVTNKPL
jgi:hypothetical protein